MFAFMALPHIDILDHLWHDLLLVHFIKLVFLAYYFSFLFYTSNLIYMEQVSKIIIQKKFYLSLAIVLVETIFLLALIFL